MNIGQKIKELRMGNNLTQEELAEELGVSFQAVSRWENSLTYPDITLLPVIANMFDVTIDWLLDLESYKKKEDIDKIIKQNRILLNQGKTKERLELLEEAIKRYPSSWEIKEYLMFAYFTNACTYRDNTEIYEEYDQKAIKIAQNILDKCVIDSIRYSAMQTLVLTYRERKELDKAKEIVEKLPDMIVSKDYLWPDVVTGTERIEATQHIFAQLVDIFYLKLVTTYGRAEVGKRDRELLKYKEFLDVVYENGDYGFNHIRLYDMYFMCAIDQAKVQNKDKTIDYLNKTLEHLKIYLNIYNGKETIKHTSFLVDRIVDDPSNWSFSGEPNQSLKIDMLDLINRDIFDFVRNDSAFIMLVEELKKILS